MRALSTCLNIRDTSGVNTHFPYGAPNNYARVNGTPYQPTIDAILGLTPDGIPLGCRRERWWGSNAQQNKVFDLLPDQELYGFCGDLSSSETAIRNAVKGAKTQTAKYGKKIFAGLCGPNEPNANELTSPGKWIKPTVEFMRIVHDEVNIQWPDINDPTRPDIYGPALKHNGVGRLDHQYRDLAAFVDTYGNKISAYIDCLDYHFYSGGYGPGRRVNLLSDDANPTPIPGLVAGSDGMVSIEEKEQARAQQIAPEKDGAGNYLVPVGGHSEWGFTRSTKDWRTGHGNATEEDWAAVCVDLTIETYLRDNALGIKHSITYEAVNEYNYKPPGEDLDEGNFGLWTIKATPEYPVGPKPAYYACKTLFSYTGTEDFSAVGHLEAIAGVESDAIVTVLSKGDGEFDIYVCRNAEPKIHLVLDTDYALTGGRLDPAGFYEVRLDGPSSGGGVTVLNVTKTGGGDPGSAPEWTSAILDTISLGETFTGAIAATGATSYAITPGQTPPAGLTIDATTGTPGGIATRFGAFELTINATNDYGTTTSPLIQLSVWDPPHFDFTAPPATVKVGRKVDYAFGLRGYPRPIAEKAGTLATGLKIGSAAHLNGVAADGTEGTYSYSVTGRNTAGETTIGPFALTVEDTGDPGGAPPYFVSQPQPPSPVKVGDAVDYQAEYGGDPFPTAAVVGDEPPGTAWNSVGYDLGEYTTPGIFTCYLELSNPYGTVRSDPITVVVEDDGNGGGGGGGGQGGDTGPGSNPSQPGWHYVALRIGRDGSRALLDPDLPLTSVQLTDRISGPWGLTGTISPVHLPRVGEDGIPVLDEWSTEIWAMHDGKIAGGGIITHSAINGPAWGVECTGYAGYPTGMPYTSADFWVEQDVFDIIRAIWQHLQSQPGGNLGVQVSDARSGVKIGKELDRQQFDPNGEGDFSFEDGPFRLAWYMTGDLGQEIDNLAGSTPFEYHETHAWVGEDITHRLELAHPRLGRRRPGLRFVVGENVTVMPEVDHDGSDFANEVLGLGAGDGPTMKRGYAARNDYRLRRVAVVEDKSARTSRAVDAVAKQSLSWRINPEEITSLVVADHSHARLGDYSVGDEIMVTGQGDWAWLEMWVRILSITISPDTNNDATLEVIRADKLPA